MAKKHLWKKKFQPVVIFRNKFTPKSILIFDKQLLDGYMVP